MRRPEISLGRHRHRFEDVIKKDLQRMGLEVMYRINLAQERDRLQSPVRVVMNFGFHKKLGIS